MSGAGAMGGPEGTTDGVALPGSAGEPAGFSRCNLFALPLEPTVAHGGTGEIQAVRIASGERFVSGGGFLDYAEMAAGTSIGLHRHPDGESEYYLVLGGTGLMQLEDDTFEVAAGDLVRNPGGGRHGLTNTGSDPLRLFIFAVPTGEGRRA